MNHSFGWKRLLSDWRAIYVAVACVGVLVSLGLQIEVFSVFLLLAGLFFLCCFSSEVRYKYAIFFLAVYTPFEEFVLKWVPDESFAIVRFGPIVLMGISFLIIMVRRYFDSKPLYVSTPIDLPLFALVAVSLVSAIINTVPPLAVAVYFMVFLRFVVTVYFPLQIVRINRRDTTILLTTMVFVVVVQIAVGLAQSVLSTEVSEFFAPKDRSILGHRAGAITQPLPTGFFYIFGTINRYNAYGAFLAMAVIVIAAFWTRELPYRKTLIVISSAALVAILLANARAPLIALVAGFSALCVLRKSWFAIAIPFAGAVTVGILYVLFQDQVRFYGLDASNALQRILEPLSREYWRRMSEEYGRVYYLYAFYLDVYAHDPSTFMWGFGPGTMGIRAQEMFNLYPLTEMGIRRDWQFYIADVNWAYLFAQVGVIGLAAFLAALVILSVVGWRAYKTSGDFFDRRLAAAFIGLMAFAVAEACFYLMFEVRPLSLYFWFLAGIVVRISRQTKHAEGQPGETTVRSTG